MNPKSTYILYPRNHKYLLKCNTYQARSSRR